MKTTQQVHDLGQSIWLDNTTRELLIDGTLQRYISELSVTGLTSNPSIFDHAIKNGSAYDSAIRRKREGQSGEALFFELALEDLTHAADLFRPVYDATGQVDGRVSLEVSPLLAHDTAGTVKQAAQLHTRGQRPRSIRVGSHSHSECCRSAVGRLGLPRASRGSTLLMKAGA
jgi:transaldolase